MICSRHGTLKIARKVLAPFRPDHLLRTFLFGSCLSRDDPPSIPLPLWVKHAAQSRIFSRRRGTK